MDFAMLAFTRQERMVLMSLSLMIFTGSLLHLISLRFPRVRDLMRFVEQEGRAKKLDLNTVTAQELVDVPYIGEVLAGRILEYRQQKGAFQDIQELQEIKGVGPQNYLRFVSYFKVKKAIEVHSQKKVPDRFE